MRPSGPVGPDGSSIPPGKRKLVLPPDGVGNPHERMFWEGWRDWGQGEEKPKDLVYDPTCKTKKTPEEQAKHDGLLCVLQEMFQRSVIFTKFPGNVQPPWFAKPIIKAIRKTVTANDAREVLFTRTIPDRHRAILACIGLDIAPVLPYTEGALEFWFEFKGNVVPIFDDQTTTAYEESDGLTSGRTSVLPGSIENPFSFLVNGLQLILRGPGLLEFVMENKSDVSVTVRGIMGYYQYWLPYGATEFESADVQL